MTYKCLKNTWIDLEKTFIKLKALVLYYVKIRLHTWFRINQTQFVHISNHLTHFYLKIKYSQLLECNYLVAIVHRNKNIWLYLNQPLHWQHVGFFSVSLKKKMGVWPSAAPSQPQQATLGLQLGFSHTNSHFGFGHSGLVHFQSQRGSSQTASHSGFGAFR